ncbi:HMA2 domain-containing protein [Desulfomonile tiedjei]|uniref:Uncharacterized protein n=1 Tax=Desulfomonile tiedjei (strain ATCC 49306 / DSM 6799 / DCB-1) TaxID=706587 RepID=I4C2D7_DESTA|nr:hypothetical protein [Desulfomonile tiedjei]AFM23728.1 hypothetical protein Desti_1011 [Desulfomonile tiedjei DSM 6799]
MRYYVHEVPGRLRIKMPGLKRNKFKCTELECLLESLHGIGSVTANVLTGSVLIQFCPESICSHSILTLLSQEGYIDLTRAISSPQYMEEAVSNIGYAASKALLGLALDKAFEGTPLVLLAAFI